MDNQLTAEDFVIYKENGKMMSGGYSVNSILLNQEKSPIYSVSKQKGGDTVSSSIFSDLAIPGGLLFTSKINNCNKYKINYNDETDDDLFNNLLKMLDPQSKKIHNMKTKKNKNKNKITRKKKFT